MSDSLNQNPFAPPRALVQDAAQDVSANGVVDATRMQRFLAVLVDSAVGLVGAIVVGGVLLATVGVGAFTAGGGADFGAVFASVMWLFGLLFVLGLGWGIFNLVLVYRYGQVFGKRVMGIRVVRTDGSRASLPRILFMRWGLLYVIAFVTGIVAALMKMPLLGDVVYLVDVLLIFRASRLCLHDHLGDTRVVTAASSEHATLAGIRGELPAASA